MNNIDIKNISIRQMLTLFQLMTGIKGYPDEFVKTLQDYVRDNFEELVDKLEKGSAGGSFDGTNKSSEGKGQNIAYWLPTSPRLEEIKARVMANASPEAIAYLDPLNYNGPKVIRDATTMTEDEWQAARKNSIGSSAIAQVFGESPYPGCTNIDLYNSKVGIQPVVPESQEEKDRKELIFLFGHIMEEYLREWVRKKWPDCELVIDTNIYASQKADFLTTNLDGMLKLPDGTWEHIEFKTTHEFNEDYDNDSIPIQYKRQLIQCQHIMGVWRSRLIAGFTRDKVIVRTYERDLDEEYEQVLGGIDFWNNHVLPQIPPEPLGPTENIIESINKYSGPPDKNLPEKTLDATLVSNMKEFVDITNQLSEIEKKKKYLTAQKEKLMVPIAQLMGQTTKAYASDGSEAFIVTYAPRKGQRSCRYDDLKMDYPDIYNVYVKAPSESRPMKIQPTYVR